VPRSAAVAEAASFAGFEAMRGHFDRARHLCSRAEGVLKDLGQTLRLAVVRQAAGWVELRANAPAAAEAKLRASYDTLQEKGEKSVLSTTAAMLAQALEAQEDNQEAMHFTELSEHAASPDDLASQILWRATRAKLLSREGRLAEAEALARRAVAIAAETEALNLHAGALIDLAWVLRLNRRASEAASAEGDALTLYELKGNVVIRSPGARDGGGASLRRVAVDPGHAGPRGGRPRG
jgi:tetratricopeptide (TPR) repeat protein